MSFHEVRFPKNISYGSSGGPERKTEIVTLSSGFEERNSPWSQSRHSYNIAYGIKDLDQLHTVKAFFEARHGPLNGFRYLDWGDYKSVEPLQAVTPNDQDIGTGDGVLTQFQLKKAYSDASGSYERIINKPVRGTVHIAFDGVEQLTGWVVDTTTGIVTFSSVPGNTVHITAGFEFDVPVRFANDKITINLSNFESGDFQDIPLIEVRI